MSKKITIWALPINDGAGACYIKFFSSESKMKEYERVEEEGPYYQGSVAGVGDGIELEIHDDGTVTGPELDSKHTRWWEDE